MKIEKAILRDLTETIKNGSITDVGYCFDQDPSTIQFRIGAVVCRMQTQGKTISVNYGWHSFWLVRQEKSVESLLSYIGTHCILAECDCGHSTECDNVGIVDKVHLPPMLWQVCSWDANQDYFWHTSQNPPSLKLSLVKLYDPVTYNLSGDVVEFFEKLKLMSSGEPLQGTPYEQVHANAAALMSEVVSTSYMK